METETETSLSRQSNVHGTRDCGAVVLVPDVELVVEPIVHLLVIELVLHVASDLGG